MKARCSQRESGFHEPGLTTPEDEEFKDEGHLQSKVGLFRSVNQKDRGYASGGSGCNSVTFGAVSRNFSPERKTETQNQNKALDWEEEHTDTHIPSSRKLPSSVSNPVLPTNDGSRYTNHQMAIVSTESRTAHRRRSCPRHAVHHLSNDCGPRGLERVRINVSGQAFELSQSLLRRHPDTLLGNPAKRHRYFDHCRREVFLDRHRPSFEAVFAYYQYGGRLRRPITVPDDVFLEELLFYELEKEAVEEYKRSEGYTSDEMNLPANKTMRKIWMLFEYPETSRSGFVIAVISVAMTLVSIVLFCVETLPMFSMTHCFEGAAPNFLDPFFVIETICTLWFTFEAVVRFASCPSKVHFWRDFKNIVDVTAIVPYYITFFNVISTMSCSSAKSSASLAFLRVIRLVRIFKLTKHSVGLQVLILTFKASIEGLSLFLVALIVCLLVFSSAIYYAEIDVKDSQIQSIPDAFWWAIITMTTVGYGDKVPVGSLGKLIGTACAITGVLTLAIPVPIITGHFNRFYAHKTGRGRNI